MIVDMPAFPACCGASRASSSCVGVFGWGAFCRDVCVLVPASRPAKISSEPSLSLGEALAARVVAQEAAAAHFLQIHSDLPSHRAVLSSLADLGPLLVCGRDML